MSLKNRAKKGRMAEELFINPWFVVSFAVTVFLIMLLAWNLVRSNEMVRSFEKNELAIQKVSGELLRYTNSLEMAANMAAATGDLKWEIEYDDYRERLDNLFGRIPELISTPEAQAEIEDIKTYRQELDDIEREVLSLVARGEKNAASDLLAGWIYTRNQLNIILATENLADIMNAHINERLAEEQQLTSILVRILIACIAVLLVSWFVTVRIWQANLRNKQEKDEEVEYLSYHDPLTGLYNRTYLEEEMIRVDQDENLPISIIMIDFNGLKMINDTYGHSAGDEMLISGANLLSQVCRDDDTLARWGGDEFVVLLSRTSEKDAFAISNRIIDECRSTYGDKLPISMSVGTATKVKPGRELEEYLKEAEDWMYNHKLTESRSARNATVNALLKTLAECSHETEEHVLRIRNIALLVADKLELPETEIDRMILLTTLHDIGMINVPEEIFVKKEELTKKDWETVRKHPETGYRIVSAAKEYSNVAKEVLYHHENWDGSGYPEGLKGNEIPFLARIIKIADAVEVMISGRPYKKAMTPDQIINEIIDCSGREFDPELVPVFVSILEKESTIKDIINR
ncbi:MAG: HD domain-containing phosphohydrolase [Bacillota bacterium]